MIAVGNGNKRISKYLIKKGGNVNVKRRTGESILDIGLERGDKEICKLLIDYGLNVNKKSKYGQTALIRAS